MRRWLTSLTVLAMGMALTAPAFAQTSSDYGSVAVSSANSAIATVPSSVPFSAGQTSVPITVSRPPVR